MRGRCLLTLAAVALMAGCICDFSQFTKGQDVVDEFYSRLKAQDYEGAPRLFHPRFFNETSREETLRFLSSVDTKIGIVETHALKNINVETYVGTEGSGDYISLVYDVNRTR